MCVSNVQILGLSLAGTLAVGVRERQGPCVRAYPGRPAAAEGGAISSRVKTVFEEKNAILMVDCMPNTPLCVSKMCAFDVSENVHMMFLKYVHTTFLKCCTGYL